MTDAETTIRFRVLDGISSRGPLRTAQVEKVIDAIVLALACPSTRWALTKWVEELDEKGQT